MANPGLYKERLQTFCDNDIFPAEFVKASVREIQRHVLNPDTIVIEGTLGKKMSARGKGKIVEGYHLYNEKTGLDFSFDKNGRRYRTGMRLNTGQQKDLKTNGNAL